MFPAFRFRFRLYRHKNLVYDRARHESSIAQWLERPTSILEGHWLTPFGELRRFIFLSNST